MHLLKEFVSLIFFYHILSKESCMIPLIYDTILAFGGVNMNILESDKSIKNLEISMQTAYHEEKKHTDTMFAFNIYPCTIPLDFSFVPLHWQDGVEIIYVKKGMGEVRVDTDLYRAKAGDVFIVLPGHIHGISSIPSEKMEYENMFFDLDFLGIHSIDLCSMKYLHPIAEGNMTIPTYLYPGHALYNSFIVCLDYVDQLCDKKMEGYEVGVKGLILTALSVLLQEAEESTQHETSSKTDQKIKFVLKRIENDYGKNLTIEEMANECGYSASHFMRWFKENTGFSFNSYLIEYRLNHAAEQLRTSEESIINIASDAGFDNLSNFNRLFKKRFLMTPSEFRRNEMGEI